MKSRKAKAMQDKDNRIMQLFKGINKAPLLMLGLLIAMPAFADQAQQLTTCTLTPSDHIYIAMSDEIQANALKVRLNNLGVLFGLLICAVGIYIFARVVLVSGIKVKYLGKEGFVMLFVATILMGAGGYLFKDSKDRKHEAVARIQNFEDVKQTVAKPNLDMLAMCENTFDDSGRIIKTQVDYTIEKSTFKTEPLREPLN